MASTELQRAREILDEDVIGPEELQRVFGPAGTPAPAAVGAVPFSAEQLERAKAEGELLILRLSRVGGEPLTLLQLIRRFPSAFDHRYLQKVGYQLKSESGDRARASGVGGDLFDRWAIVRKEPLLQTCNLSFEEQDEMLASMAGPRLRRRSATEIAYDLVAYHGARGRRLLYDSWDWSSSRTEDGGYLNVGHFDDKGIQIFSFSPGVRHGKLGVCPNRDP